MKQYVIIGAGKFGQRIIEGLSAIECEILVIDKDRELIERLKDRVTDAYVADLLDEQTVRKLVPPGVDAAIVDLGDRTEVSILVTNYLKKIGVREIAVKAETQEHGEILEIVGATHVIFPNREAARRMVPMIAYSNLFSFMPIGEGLIIAEVRVPRKNIGMTLVEADFRKVYRFNVIATRKNEDVESGYRFYDPEYQLQADDILLVAGSEDDLSKLAGEAPARKKSALNRLFGSLLRRNGK